MHYQARYTESATSSTITLNPDAVTDRSAIQEVRDIVCDSYNDSFCSIELSDGRTYNVTNVNGHAVGVYF